MPNRRVVEVAAPPELAALKALANPLRLRLFYALGARGEATATELAAEVDLAASLVSYHLKELARYGLLELVETPNRDGRARWYRIREGGVQAADAEAEAAALSHAVLRHHIWQLTRYVDAVSTGAASADASFSSDMVITLDAVQAEAFQRDVAQLLRGYARNNADGDGARVLVMLQGIPFEP